MSRKHVINYYKQVEAQYFEMLADVKDYQEALKGGFMSEEQYTQATTLIERHKENYNRLTCIMYLLNLPNDLKKSNKARKQKINQKVEDYLNDNFASDDCVIREDSDILKEFKEKFINIEKEK